MPPVSRIESSLRAREEKYDQRRTELAISALETLGERGYARTSLHEIAQKSPYSHGVVHYYFKDKVELITYCVRYYKTQCATRYDEIVATSTTADHLRERFAARLVQTLVEDSSMHRLWYDLRTQSLFEDDFRADVLDIDTLLEQMIGRVVGRYAELAGRPLAVDQPTCYALLDGVFEKALLGHIAGQADAVPLLEQRALDVLPRLLG